MILEPSKDGPRIAKKISNNCFLTRNKSEDINREERKGLVVMNRSISNRTTTKPQSAT